MLRRGAANWHSQISAASSASELDSDNDATCTSNSDFPVPDYPLKHGGARGRFATVPDSSLDDSESDIGPRAAFQSVSLAKRRRKKLKSTKRAKKIAQQQQPPSSNGNATFKSPDNTGAPKKPLPKKLNIKNVPRSLNSNANDILGDFANDRDQDENIQEINRDILRMSKALQSRQFREEAKRRLDLVQSHPMFKFAMRVYSKAGHMTPEAYIKNYKACTTLPTYTPDPVATAAAEIVALNEARQIFRAKQDNDMLHLAEMREADAPAPIQNPRFAKLEPIGDDANIDELRALAKQYQARAEALTQLQAGASSTNNTASVTTKKQLYTTTDWRTPRTASQLRVAAEQDAGVGYIRAIDAAVQRAANALAKNRASVNETLEVIYTPYMQSLVDSARAAITTVYRHLAMADQDSFIMTTSNVVLEMFANVIVAQINVTRSTGVSRPVLQKTNVRTNNVLREALKQFIYVRLDRSSLTLMYVPKSSASRDNVPSYRSLSNSVRMTSGEGFSGVIIGL